MSKFFKNPYINSICAEAYIIIIVSIMHIFSAPNTPDTFLSPIAALSLFVLSAAIMGYLFLGEPLQLYLNGEKTQAVSFFMRTVLSFAAIMIIVLIVLQFVV